MKSLPTTLFMAIRRSDGKNVCVDTDSLRSTTKVVRDLREYEVAIGQGWCDHPLEAMARLEAAQASLSVDAAVRAHDDRRMSEAAQAEADAADAATGFTFVPEVPEAPKKRGRPKTRTETTHG